MDEVRVLAAKTHLGITGGGITNSIAFLKALDRKPGFVGIQSASTDQGPYFLGIGASSRSREHIKAELESYMLPCLQNDVPFAVGGAPDAGTKLNVDWLLDIVREISSEHNLKFKLSVIYSDVSKEYLLERLRRGECFKHLELKNHDLTPNDVDESDNIVAFMGWEPFIRALDVGANVIITGRCCDDAIFSAPAIRAGIDPGIAWHMGKLMECGSMVATPVNLNIPIMATVRADHFLLEPMHESIACTVGSVTAHNLYERRSSFAQEGPAGILDMSGSRYERHSERVVKVSGARFGKAPYQVLVEGSGFAGYRSISINGVRDKEVICRLLDFEETCEKRVREVLRDYNFKVIFHNYGIDGCMGPYEPNRGKPTPSYEVSVVIEVISPLQCVATDVCWRLYRAMVSMMYEGRVSGEGNLASPFAPPVLEIVPAYRFIINHLVPLKDPFELFPMHLYEVRSDNWQEVSHD